MKRKSAEHPCNCIGLHQRKDLTMYEGGFLGLIILALDIWAIVKLLDSSASSGAKVLWILLILFLPVLGLIIWLVAGPRGGR